MQKGCSDIEGKVRAQGTRRKLRRAAGAGAARVDDCFCANLHGGSDGAAHVCEVVAALLHEDGGEVGAPEAATDLLEVAEVEAEALPGNLAAVRAVPACGRKRELVCEMLFASLFSAQ